MRQTLRQRAQTALAAAIGALTFFWLGLPLPLLLGPMTGCLVFALAGVSLRDMGVLGTLMRTFLGVAIGSSVTPELIRSLPDYGATLALVPLFVFAIGGVGYPFFRRVIGLDHPTAYYAAMPGGLQDMLIFGEEAGGDVRAMSLIHATRVLAIVTVAPFLLAWSQGVDLGRPPGAPLVSVPVSELVLMLAAALVGWRVGLKIGLFGAAILGPLILTAALSLAGLVHQRPPAEVIWAAQLFIGVSIGSKYSGITGRELRMFVGAGLAFTGLVALISLAFIAVAIRSSPASTLDVSLSFLPGGQGEMVVIAIIAGADVAFVVVHHLARVFLVILIAPLLARWFGRK